MKGEKVLNILLSLMENHGIFVRRKVVSHYDVNAILFQISWNREIEYNEYKQSFLVQGYDKYRNRQFLICHWETVCTESGIWQGTVIFVIFVMIISKIGQTTHLVD
uniref:Uncharacterized protein n=1 Tax=Lepeophtheirus salmonis TaxID=72036 RepID=A0A0K2TA06_LEPSM